jgi:hypothetical protein
VPTDFQTDVQSTSNSQAQVDDRAQSKMERKKQDMRTQEESDEEK